MKIEVYVKLNKDFISEKEGKLIVGIKSKPIDGKANRELIRKLADYFDVDIDCVKIISGKKSRKKIIEIP